MKFWTILRVHEANAVGGQQARATTVVSLERVGLGIDDLIGHARSQQIEHVGEHDDHPDQHHEDHNRVRDSISDAFHEIQYAGETRV